MSEGVIWCHGVVSVFFAVPLDSVTHLWLANDMPTTATTTGRKAGKESDMDFTAITAGCIPTGTVTPLGRIESSTLTAYRIAGEFVPFARVHGKAPMAEMLATVNWGAL